MIKNNFKTKQEVENYLKAEKILIENKQSILSFSERQQIINNQIKAQELVIKEEKSKPYLVASLLELKKSCELVAKEDNIQEIVQKLKNTLIYYNGLGISANQIGINKRISYIKIPKVTKDKKIEYNEYILINAKIIEKDRPTKITNEGCLSFPGISVITRRYVFITVEYFDEKMQLQTMAYQDLEALIFQHEIDHQFGKTIFDRKWRKK